MRVWPFSRVDASPHGIPRLSASSRILSLAASSLLLLSMFAGVRAFALKAGDPAPAQLSADAVVHGMMAHNKWRAEQLTSYSSVRHYHVEYHGFFGKMAADVEVEAIYDAPDTKSFRVISESGSHVLINHVVMKLLAEEERAVANQSHSALTPENYSFEMEGVVTEDGRRLYVLDVTPKRHGKLLYRGKVWVDAEDFAVRRIEAHPAKSPSFWIHDTRIHHSYAKYGEFWLPLKNESNSKIRLGGSAELTIDYGHYTFTDPGAKSDPLQPGGSE